ncbi:MAG: hypothetical protein K6B72_04610 [Lachnospiraceae bacterium]|nr:hypothetical protein [Lachnospiraceae bacterium]
MMVNRKYVTYAAVAITAMAVLTACGAKKTAEQATKQEQQTKASTAVYAATLEELHASGAADSFALVDVDGDSTPELAAVDSEGPAEANTFLYTISSDGQVVEHERCMTGYDGAAIYFSEGKSILLTTQHLMGDTFLWKEVKGGKIKVLLEAQSSGYISDDPSGQEFLVDGKSVSLEEYSSAMNDYFTKYSPMTRIDLDGLTRVNASMTEDVPEFEVVETTPYVSYEEIRSQLGQ